jgi:hypothetical protein
VLGLANVTVLQWELGSGVIWINVCHCRLFLIEFRNDFLFHYTVCLGSNVIGWDATTLMSRENCRIPVCTHERHAVRCKVAHCISQVKGEHTFLTDWTDKSSVHLIQARPWGRAGCAAALGLQSQEGSIYTLFLRPMSLGSNRLDSNYTCMYTTYSIILLKCWSKSVKQCSSEHSLL